MTDPQPIPPGFVPVQLNRIFGSVEEMRKFADSNGLTIHRLWETEGWACEILLPTKSTAKAKTKK
jgi:hypothetical protein